MTTDARAQLQASLGDNYSVERELGGGGMSRVFLVHETRLKRDIVVKVLPPEMAADVSIMRFEREIALAARLQHPHIVPLLATGETQGLPYYSMPYVEGETLRERLTRVGELPVAEAVRLLREIATALAYAHEKGLVHRDIKPENVLLSGGIALVADFGVAKALIASATASDGGLTSVGVSIGTPAYMSPEQVAADPSVDHRADLYALGMVAYEMLTGQAPFAGRPVQALLSAHITDKPEPLERRRPAVPPALAALVMKCLEKRPADRPQSALEIVQALDALVISSATAQTPSDSASRGASWTSGSRAALLAVAATVVVLAASGVWLRFGRSPAPPALSGSRLLVAPFENLTGDPRLDYVGGVAADGLALAVAQSGSMDVVPSTTVLMALRDTSGGISDRLNRLAVTTHAGMQVSGSVARRGDSLVLQAQLTDLRTGKIVNTLDPQIGPAGDPVAIVNALGDRLLAALGSRELTILAQRGFRAPKNAAYQEFAKGFERFALQGDLVGARPYFARAIAIDSGYVRAYQLLQRMSINLGEFDRADSIGRQIEKLSLSAAERFQQDYNNAELRGDVPATLRSMQQLAARDSSALSLALVGEAGTYMLRPDISMPAFEHAIPTFILMGGRAATRQLEVFAEVYHQAGRYDRELDLLTRNESAFPDIGVFRARKLRAYGGSTSRELAISLADTLLRSTDDSTGAAVMRVTNSAQEFRAHGDTATAARLLAMNRAWVTAHPPRASSPDRQLSEGVLFLLTGSSDSAMARFNLALAKTNRIEAAGYLGIALVAHGDSVRARIIADSLGAMTRPWLFGNHTYWRAAIIGAIGDRNLATQLLQKSYGEGKYMDEWHFTPALNAMRGYAPFDLLVTPRR